MFVSLEHVPGVVFADPDDDVILACATGAGADYIISRDRHLTALGKYRGIAILPPDFSLPVLRSYRAQDEITVDGAN